MVVLLVPMTRNALKRLFVSYFSPSVKILIVMA
jgi:hypothetical protein